MSEPQRTLGWTLADESEFDFVTVELVHGLHEHYPRCPRCQARVHCPAASGAIDAVVEWITARRLLSRALLLRRCQAELDAELGVFLGGSDAA
jgi:hypothetical protein